MAAQSRSTPERSPAATLLQSVRAVLALVFERRATLGRTRLVCVDGPAGSGKTTFANALVQAAGEDGVSAAVVHMDDVYEGWSGLREGGPRVHRQIVEPLAAGRSGAYRRYDWILDRYAEELLVPPTDLLVVEGVGSGHLGFADAITLLVWVEAPRELRLRRGLDRDGEAMLPHWLAWTTEEDVLHEQERTRERADVHLDGVAGTLVVRRSGSS